MDKKTATFLLLFGLMMFSVPANAVTQWNKICDTGGRTVQSMAVYNGKLYYGGMNPDGIIYVYDGTSCSVSYDSLETDIRTLAVYNNKLYAGTSPNGVILVYDGASWNVSYDIPRAFIESLAVYNGKLYVGTSGFGLYTYDGISWNVNTNLAVNFLQSMAVYNGKLYAGASGGNVSVYDGASWTVSYDSPESHVQSLAVYNNRLYAGTCCNGIIYVYDGTSWATSYDSAASQVYAFAVYNNKLYASGIGTIYVYDATSPWNASSDSPTFATFSLAVYNNKLYAGSYGGIYATDFSATPTLTSTPTPTPTATPATPTPTAATTTQTAIPTQTPTPAPAGCAGSWSQLYDAPGYSMESLATYGGKLYVGAAPGGALFSYDGTSWSANTGLGGGVEALASYNGKLYAGTCCDGLIYVYDGTAWSASRMYQESNKYLTRIFKSGDSYKSGDYTITVTSVNVSSGTPGKTATAITVTGPAGNTESKVLSHGDSYKFLLGAIEVEVNAVLSPLDAELVIRNNKLADLRPWAATVMSFAVYDGKLYAGTRAAGAVYVYDGNSWNLSYSIPEQMVSKLTVYDGKLYAATRYGGTVYAYDGNSWTLSYKSPEEQIISMAAYGTKLYIGTYPNGLVYAYDGTSWSMSYDTPATRVSALIVQDNVLCAFAISKLYTYDGTSWSGGADTLGGYTMPFAVYNGKLYAGYGGRVYGLNVPSPAQVPTAAPPSPIKVDIPTPAPKPTEEKKDKEKPTTVPPAEKPARTEKPAPTTQACPDERATLAVNPEGKNCRQFPTSCDVPRNWMIVASCPSDYRRCEGCLAGDFCIQFGTRLAANGTATYCDFVTGGWARQKNDNEACQNNYECLSNYCAGGVCGDIQKELSGIRDLLNKIVDFLKGLLSPGRLGPA